jgi:hypothetical protein
MQMSDADLHHNLHGNSLEQRWANVKHMNQHYRQINDAKSSLESYLKEPIKRNSNSTTTRLIKEQERNKEIKH